MSNNKVLTMSNFTSPFDQSVQKPSKYCLIMNYMFTITKTLNKYYFFS